MIEPLFSGPAADVLLLGTYHMDNSRRDVVRFVADDVLADRRQRELADLVASLAQFHPTKICVEVPPSDSARPGARGASDERPTSQQDLDEQFARFQSGELEPRRNEVAQIAFPLARAAGLDVVYGINDWTPMRWDRLEAFFSRHSEENRRYQEWLIRSREKAEEHSRKLADTPLRDFLRERNQPEVLRRDAAVYVDLAGLGGVEEHGGADMLASWYERNIRIFSNLCGVTSQDDRIFVLIGAGHVPILRELIGLSSRHRLVDLSLYV